MSGRRRDLMSPLDLVDVLVNVVVLNLAVQFVPSVISETFTLSLLTAVLLKVVLEVVVAGKGSWSPGCAPPPPRWARWPEQ